MMRILPIDEVLGSAENAITRNQLAGTLPDYELHEDSILDAFEAHPITEIALWRGTESGWVHDSFESRMRVLQLLIGAHFEQALRHEIEIRRQVDVSIQRRDLRRLAERVRALHEQLPGSRRVSRAGDSAA